MTTFLNRQSDVDKAIASMSSSALGAHLTSDNIDGYEYILMRNIGLALFSLFFAIWAFRRYKAEITQDYSHLSSLDPILAFAAFISFSVAMFGIKLYPEKQKYLINTYNNTVTSLENQTIIESSQLPDPIGSSYYYGFAIYIPNMQQRRAEYVKVMRRNGQFDIKYNTVTGNLIIQFSSGYTQNTHNMFDHVVEIPNFPQNKKNYISMYISQRDVKIYMNGKHVSTTRMNTTINVAIAPIYVGSTEFTEGL
jgi:hypothetical protein